MSIINYFKKKTSISKTVIFNLLSTFIIQGVSFLTLPIFSRVLGSEQYGLYSVFHSWVIILSNFISLGISSCIGSGKYYFKDEYYNFRSNIAVFNVLISTFVILIFLVLYKYINILIGYDFYLYIVLLLTAFSTNIINLFNTILIYEKKAVLNFTFSVILSISTVVLSLYFIFFNFFVNKYIGRVFGNFIPYIVLSFFCVSYIMIYKSFKLDIKFLKYGFVVGVPIVFHLLAHYVLGQSDRIMMQKMNIADADIGIYSLYYYFCGAVNILLNTFNNSFSAFYLDYIDCDDKQNIIIKSKNYIEVFTIICIGFILLSREVSCLMADYEFYSGINLIPIFIGSIYFIFMYQFAVNYEFYYRKTKTIALGTLCAAISNIFLNLYFIPKYGIYGAAYATIISYALLYIFHYIIVKLMSEKRFYLPFSMYIIGIICILFSSIIFYVFSDNVLLRWILGIMLGVFEIYRIYIRKGIF